MNKNLKFIFGCFLLLLTLGCSPKENTISRYNITLSSGGGFTGSYNGYYIDTTGTVSQWEGRTFDLSTRKVVTHLSPDKLKEINDKITTLGIMNVNYKISGNISSSISISNNDSTHLITWAGIEPSNDIPENIREFYYYMKNLITTSITK